MSMRQVESEEESIGRAAGDRGGSSWWVGAVPGLETLGSGARVDLIRDAPGASVITTDWVASMSIDSRQDVSSAKGDPERPVWRIGDVTMIEHAGDHGLDFTTAFTIIDVAPAWQRFGPGGDAVTSVLRRLRSVTLEVVESAGEMPLPPGEFGPTGCDLAWFIRTHGSDSERWRWTIKPTSHRSVESAEWAAHRILGIAMHELDPRWTYSRNDRRSAGFQAIRRAAALAAGAAAAGPAITDTRRVELSAAWEMLELDLAPEPWGPYPTRAERRLEEIFRLVHRVLDQPMYVSPYQVPDPGAEVAPLFDLPFIYGGDYLGVPWRAPEIGVLPAATRLIVSGTGMSGTYLRVVSQDRTVVADAPGALMALVRPDEPVLADPAGLSDLLARLIALHADVA